VGRKKIRLTREGALIIGSTGVIADLHLGIESTLEERGVAIPSMQLDELVERSVALVEEFSLQELVIAGDLKHEFSRNVPGEWRDVRRYVESLRDVVRLRVVRGNHDNYLAAILADYSVEFADAVEVEGYAVVHGHRDWEGDRIIMGHEHPSIKVRHSGAVYSFRCFLHARSEDREVWVLPAFSTFFPGSNVLEGEFLSPILREFRSEEIDVYAIEDDVYYMGNLKVLSDLL